MSELSTATGHLRPAAVALRRIAPLWPLVLVIAIGVSLSTRYFTVDAAGLASVHEDDSCYYLTIGRHLARGEWFTFDGVEKTNGFHPLWALFATAAAACGRSPENSTRIYFAIQYLLFHASAALLWFVLRRLVTGAVACLGTLAFVVPLFFYKHVITGLETSLFVFLLLATFLLIAGTVPRSRPGKARLLLCGLAGSSLFLARLDLGLAFAVVLGAGLAWRLRRQVPGNGARLVLLVSGTAAPALIWIGLSYSVTGMVVPVSGELKQQWASAQGVDLRDAVGFSTPFDQLAGLLARGFRGGLVLGAPTFDCRLLGPALCGLVLAFYAALRARTRGTPAHRTLDLFVVAAVLGLVLDKCALGFGALPYYYAVGIDLAVLIAAVVVFDATLVRVLPSTRSRVLLLLPVTMLLLLIGHRNQTDLSQYWSGRVEDRDRCEAASWIRSNLPADAVGASFNSGIFAFWSGHDLCNLDGKVNSRTYFQTVVARLADSKSAYEDALIAYLRSRRVSFLVEKGPDNPMPYRFTFQHRPDFLSCLEEIARFASPTPGMSCRVFWIRWDRLGGRR